MPIAVAADSSGNVFVINQGDYTVREFAPGATTSSATLTGLNDPVSLAIDGSGNLYVGNGPIGTVSMFAKGATTPSTTFTGLDNPIAMVFDGHGNLFVANIAGDTVSKFAPGSTTPTATLGGLTAPDALAVDNDGDLYAVNKGAYTVSKFTPPGFTINDGNGGKNYTVTLSKDNTGVITKAPLTITATAYTKTYNSTATAAATPTVIGLKGIDSVTSLKEVYSDANAGSSKTLSVTAYTILDNFSGNDYSVVTVLNTNGLINKAILSITATANTKTYDAKLKAGSLPTVAGLIGGDGVTDLVEVYGDASAGSSKILSVSAFTITDKNGGNNYAVTAVISTAGLINKAPVIVTGISANDKVYDGTITAVLNTGSVALQGVINGDVVALDASAATGVFPAPDVGNALTILISGLVTAGPQSGDYAIIPPAITASISPAQLTATGITATANSKVYDGTANATFNVTSAVLMGQLGSDSVTVTGGAGAFDGKDAGTNIPVMLTSLTLGGPQGKDYAAVVNAIPFTANITLAPLTIQAINNTKTFDSTTSAAVAPTVSGLQGGDSVVGLAEAYADQNAGSGKTLSVIAYTILDGVGGMDYTVTTLNSAAGVINKASVTIKPTANTKTYDSTTTAAAVPMVVGLLGNDSITGLVEKYLDRNVGNAKTLVIGPYTLNDGNGGNNYAVTLASQPGAITQAPLTFSATSNSKTYDGQTTAAALPLITGLFGGDMASGKEVYSNASAGSGKLLSVTSLVVNDGDGSADYAVITLTNATGQITPAPLTITALTAGTWSTPSAMVAVRVRPSTTLLSNGKVLVAGGYSGTTSSTTQATAELYNPATDTWSAAASMSTPRWMPGTALLPNGKVLVAGGGSTNGSALASAELYDPATNTWSSAGNMSAGRWLPSTILLQNGKVLVVGGTFATTVAQLFDPATNTWSSAGSPGIALQGQRAVLLPSGQVLVTGGENPTENYVASCELYDPTTNTWTNAAPMANIRSEHSITLLQNGKVLVAGGFTGSFVGTAINSAEIYNPLTNTWSSAGSLAIARARQSAALLPNGQVLVMGGENSTGTLTSAELYNPSGNTWLPAAPMATSRDFLTSRLLPNGEVLVVGGNASSNPGNSQLYAAGPFTIANNKTYDSTPAASLNLSTLVLSGIYFHDAVTLSTISAVGTFASKNVGNNITVTTSGFTIGGAQAGNYTLLQPTTTVNITPAPLTITATANSKTYDSTTTTAETPTVSGLRGSDTVSGQTEAYADSDAGTDKTLSVSGYTVNDDNGGNNYAVTVATNASGLITKAALTITALPNTKTFDNTTFATAIPTVSGLQGGDTVAGLAEVYADPNAGTSKTLSVSAYTISDGSSGNNYAVTSQVNTTGVIINPVDHFALVPGTTSATAGVGFAVLVIAENASNQPVNYSGPITLTSNDPQVPSEGTLVLSSGYGAVAVALDSATTTGWTITATLGNVATPSSAIMVSPGVATSFVVTAPGTATTGNSFNITVKAQDGFGNAATGYTGTVKFISSDAALAPVNNYTFTGSGPGNDNGVHTFTSALTLNIPGYQTITVTDTAAKNPAITGTSAAITTRGLTVAAFAPNPTGFTASFSKAFQPADLTLFGATKNTVMDVTVVGALFGPIHGSLIIDPSNMTVTFKATASYLQELSILAQPGLATPVLPDDTYTVTLVSGSGSNGFIDTLGAHLDGANNGGHANYVTSFTTHFRANANPILGIPDMARGPDSNTPIKVPNGNAQGIPITLYNAVGVTDVSFTLTYNPALLNVTGALQGANSDATDPAGTLTLTGNSGGVATFTFHDANRQSGLVVLGDIAAVVPSSAANNYKAKELLQIGNITINQGAITGAVSANGLHINAYLGDVNGNGTIDGLDTLTANQLASGPAPGFGAYQLLDPVIVGDVANDLSVDAGDVSAIDLYAAQLHPVQIPTPPGFAVTSPNAADPTLSLPSDIGTSSNGIVLVPVLLDHPHPVGSTGLTEAVLALTYDPKMVSASPSDITLGSLLDHGTGWQLSSVVDQTTGQIGIELYSLTPITATHAGSLVNIAFHVLPGQTAPTTAVQLVSAVTPNGQQFSTEVADTEGAMILSPGVDQVQVQTSVGYESNHDMLWQVPAIGDTISEVNYRRANVDLFADTQSDVKAGASETPITTQTSLVVPEVDAPPVGFGNGTVSAATSIAIPQFVGQVFYFGTLPLLNTLLYENSPAQSVTNRLFLCCPVVRLLHPIPQRWTCTGTTSGTSLLINRMGRQRWTSLRQLVLGRIHFLTPPTTVSQIVLPS